MDIIVAVAFGIGVVLWAFVRDRQNYKTYNQRINEEDVR